VETLAYVGEVPWHKLGTAVLLCVRANEMVHKARDESAHRRLDRVGLARGADLDVRALNKAPRLAE